MAQLDKLKNDDVGVEKESLSQRVRRFGLRNRKADGNSVVWAKPKRVLASSAEFALFATVFGVMCWAVNWGVTYLVGLLV